MKADANTATRSLHRREGVGLTASIVQQCSLRLSSVTVDQPALVLMRHGRKTLKAGKRRWQADPGDVIVIAGGQTLDIENRQSADGLFAARWVVWDTGLLAHAPPPAAARRALPDVAVLKAVPAGFVAAIERAAEAISASPVLHDVSASPAQHGVNASPAQHGVNASPAQHGVSAEPALPGTIAAHRMTELLLWLAEHGLALSGGRATSTRARLRSLITGTPAEPWTAASAASRIATSEATLRRRLQSEGTRFNDVLTDARMSLALTLLQSTERPVATIAADVGYESASRFAVRFKHRYGFSPSVVRGHQR